MTQTFFRRWALGIVLALLLPMPWIARWGALALASNTNQANEWLPAEFPETQKYSRFIDHFGTDEILVASWEGCSLTDLRLDRFAQGVADLHDANGEPLFQKRVWTGRSVLKEMMGPPLELSRAEAVDRMKGWLVGPDGLSTAAILVIDGHAIHDRQAAVDAVRSVANNLRIADDSFHLGGPTVDSVAIDYESQRSLYLLTSLSVLVGLLLSWRFLKSMRLVVLVFLTGVVSELTSLSMVWLAGSSMDSVLIMMPALVYILAVSGSIHQLNYYVDEVNERGAEGAAGRALAQSWQPSLLANATTALGLLSLSIGDVVPIRKFGVFAAIGVSLSTLYLFLLLPAMLTLWPPRHVRRPTHAAPVQRSMRRSASLRVALVGIRYYRAILWACVLLLPVLGYGVSQIRTSVRLQDLFSDQSQVIQDYRWLESHVGPLVPVEIVLAFDRRDPHTTLDRLKLVERVRQEVEDMQSVGGTISAATFAPPLPKGRSMFQVGARRVIDRQLAAHLPLLEQTHYLADDDPDEQMWRISARVEAFNDIDYGQFLDTLRRRVEPVLAGTPGGEHVRAIFCGGVPTVSMVQRQMLRDLASSFGLAFLTIGCVLALVFLFNNLSIVSESERSSLAGIGELLMRSLAAALVMMLPNVLPVLAVFGVMGWTGVTVDLGSMMTISTALGISVDNELHFFSWFRRALKRGLRRNAAVLAAYRHCGGAMAQTGIICGLGMLTFALSPFVPIARFGWLMFLLLASAMVGDLILLPALLTGPMGRFFGRPPRPKPAVVAEDSEPGVLETVGSLRHHAHRAGA